MMHGSRSDDGWVMGAKPGSIAASCCKTSSDFQRNERFCNKTTNSRAASKIGAPQKLLQWPVLTLFLVIAAQCVRGAEATPDFNTHVLPILNKYCSACHNADDAKGKLVLDN